MEIFVRTLAIYLFLLFLFRIAGKRVLSQLSTFDLILLLIISEATQNALIDDDWSLTTAFVVILSLVLLDLGLSFLKKRFGAVEKLTEGIPLILVNHGEIVQEHLDKSHVTQSDIMEAARRTHGLERMAQIKYAVLETSGGISVIPAEPRIEQVLDRRIEAALDRRMGR